MEGLDLSGAMPVDIATIDILNNATGVATGWKITLAGPAHPLTIALGEEVSRERMAKEKAIEFAQINGRKWKVDDESPEQRVRTNVERVCRRIIGWEPNPVFPQVDKEPIPFTLKAATDLLVRPDMGWVFLQLVEYLTSEKAFTKRSATK